MKNGLGRFTFYLDQVKDLMDKAKPEKDPAMWLFRNNARTPFFMLEALSRLYAGMHNRRKFDKLRKRFKVIEDGLGEIDYFNSLVTSFETDKKIPADCGGYAKKRLQESSARLNEILIKEGWLAEDNSRIKKITTRLENADWLKPDKEVDEIARFYKKAIGNINEFILDTKYLFDNVEEDVHELRRRIRWLSIYPQATGGVFQFDAISPAPNFHKKYLTKEITESPFNKLPKPGNNTSFVILNKKYFFALSWMIAKLGELKDEGLLITGLAEAIKYNTGCSEKDAINEAYSSMGIKQKRLKQILSEAELLSKMFIREKNLKYLVMRTNKGKKKILRKKPVQAVRMVKADSPAK